MFESFNVPAFYIGDTNIMATYASGRGTTITVNSGEGVTTILPIYEGHAIKAGVQRTHIGGQGITHHLANLLEKRGYHFNTGVVGSTYCHLIL